MLSNKSTSEYVRSVYEKKQFDELIVEEMKHKIKTDEQNQIAFYKIEGVNENNTKKSQHKKTNFKSIHQDISATKQNKIFRKKSLKIHELE